MKRPKQAHVETTITVNPLSRVKVGDRDLSLGEWIATVEARLVTLGMSLEDLDRWTRSRTLERVDRR